MRSAWVAAMCWRKPIATASLLTGPVYVSSASGDPAVVLSGANAPVLALACSGSAERERAVDQPAGRVRGGIGHRQRRVARGRDHGGGRARVVAAIHARRERAERGGRAERERERRRDGAADAAGGRRLQDGVAVGREDHRADEAGALPVGHLVVAVAGLAHGVEQRRRHAHGDRVRAGSQRLAEVDPAAVGLVDRDLGAVDGHLGGVEHVAERQVGAVGALPGRRQGHAGGVGAQARGLAEVDRREDLAPRRQLAAVTRVDGDRGLIGLDRGVLVRPGRPRLRLQRPGVQRLRRRRVR